MTPVALGARGAVLAGSLVLTVLTAGAAVDVPWVGVGALVLLAGVAATRPDTWWPLALLAVHGLVWTTSVPAPRTTATWVAVLAAALLALSVHLAASWAGSVPPRAAVPTSILRTWGVRLAGGAACTAAAWALAWGSAGGASGQSVGLTLATALVLLGAAVLLWRLARR